MKNDENHVVFELSSKVVDFAVIENDNEPDTLVILSEEEIVFVDLGIVDDIIDDVHDDMIHSDEVLACV